MATTARKFGVELEVIGGAATKYDMARALTAAGVACYVEGYNHTTRNAWKLVPDASLSGSNAVELVSPPLPFNAESVATLRTVCATLNALGVTVNSSCGFHVHVDASDLGANGVKNLLALVLRFEQQMDKLVPASRRSTRWAKSNAVTLTGRPVQTYLDLNGALGTLEQVQDVYTMQRAMGRDRYHKLNLEAMGRHGTVEFRQNAGTTNADKVVGWVALCVGLTNAAKRARSVAKPTTQRNRSSFARMLDRVEPQFRGLLVARAAELAAREQRAAAAVRS